MDIEKLTELAEQGDVQAMLDLAGYYYDPCDYEKLEMSVIWDDRAGRAGSDEGVLRAMTGFRLLAVINESGSYEDWERAAQYENDAKEWAQIALENIQLDFENFKLVKKVIEESSYGAGYCYYQLGRYNDALDALDEFDDTKYEVLKGTCLYSLNTNHDVLVSAYRKLRVIEEDTGYFQAEKNEDEELVFSDAVLKLSSFYRIGLVGTLNANLECSVRILSMALQVIKSERLRRIIQNELNRYQKKMFGGYKYNG